MSTVKVIKKGLTSLVLASVVFVTACNSNNSEKNNLALTKVLDVAEKTMNKLNANPNKVDESKSVDLFAQQFADELYLARVYPNFVEVQAQKDGSFEGYYDDNKNLTKDAGEKSVFTIEVDGENSKLIASSGEQRVSGGFNMSGLFMGMMIGNLLSRQSGAGISRGQMSQRSAGATSRSSVRATAQRAAASARNRAGSGSFSRGK